MGFDDKLFLSAEFIRLWDGKPSDGEPSGEPNLSAMCKVRSAIAKPKLSAVREHCPPEKLPFRYSPFTTH